MSSWTLLRGALASTAAPENASADALPAQKSEAEAQAAADLAAMQRVQSGDQQALSFIYDRYARAVLRVGLRVLRDVSEAQELVQEVFLYVFRKSQDFNPAKSSLSTWLMQIAYSRGINKREYLTLRRFYDYRHIDDVLESLVSDCSLEANGQTSELRELLRGALNDLNEVQRRTLEMFFWEGYSLREISVQLNETVGNTRNHYYRGLEKLRTTVKLSIGHRHNGGR